MSERLRKVSNAEAGTIDTIVLVKGAERYVFAWDGDCEHETAEILRAVERLAGNPELTFSWYDAAVVCGKVRATHRRSKG